MTVSKTLRGAKPSHIDPHSGGWLARHVEPGSRVLSLGAGAETLRALAARDCRLLVAGSSSNELDGIKASCEQIVEDDRHGILPEGIAEGTWVDCVLVEDFGALAEPEDSLDAFRRLLRPGGIFITAVPNAG